MRLGSLRLDSRTARGFRYAVASCTMLMLFIGFGFLLVYLTLPEARDLNVHLWPMK